MLLENSLPGSGGFPEHLVLAEIGFALAEFFSGGLEGEEGVFAVGEVTPGGFDGLFEGGDLFREGF